MTTLSEPDRAAAPMGGVPKVWLILNYHRVGRPPPAARYRGMFVSPSHLQSHIRRLKQAGMAILPVGEALTSGLPRVASLTFDDGYEDNLTAGFPILQKEGVRGSVYLVTGDVGRKQHRWKEAGESLPADLLDWEQVGFLKANGWEIGSHGREHIHLGRRSPDQQAACIGGSQEDLRRFTGEAALTFAYPYGSYAAETLDAVAAAGFRASLSTRQGRNCFLATGPLEKDLFILKRQQLRGYRFYHHVTNVGKLPLPRVGSLL